jgi:hypothetical protein
MFSTVPRCRSSRQALLVLVYLRKGDVGRSGTPFEVGTATA